MVSIFIVPHIPLFIVVVVVDAAVVVIVVVFPVGVKVVVCGPAVNISLRDAFKKTPRIMEHCPPPSLGTLGHFRLKLDPLPPIKN